MLKSILLFLVSSSYGFASESVTIKGDGIPAPISSKTSEYIETGGEQTIENIMSLPLDRFKRNTTSSNTLSNAFKTFWVRFSVENPTLQELDLIIDLGIHSLNRANLYETQDRRVLNVQKVGRDAPLNQRKIKTFGTAFKTTIPPGRQKLYFLELKNELPVTMPIMMRTSDDFYHQRNRHSYILLLFIGLVLTICLNNLLHYMSTHDPQYRDYALMVLLLHGICIGSFFGASQILMPDHWVWWHHHALMLGKTLGFIATNYFCKRFLSLDRFTYPNLILKWGSILSFALAVALVITNDVALIDLLHNIVLLPCLLLIFYISTKLLLRRERNGVLFFIANAPFLVVAMVLVLSSTMGVDAHTSFFHKLLIPACAFEIAIIAFAIADNVRRITSKHRSEIELLNTNLSHKVKEQTISIIEKEQRLRVLLRTVIHDISNPLSVIFGRAELIQESLDGYGKKHVEAIIRGANTITKIIDDVKLRETKNNRINEKNLPVLVDDLIGHIEFTFSEKMREKNIQLEVKSSLDKDTKVLGQDGILKNQIMNNLLSNAIKFSNPNGRILIEVSQEDPWIKIQVKDQGVGIPNEILEKIFDDQAETSRPGTMNEVGSGFGMPITKHFLQDLGGTIDIRSRVGEGTEVEIGLRVYQDHGNHEVA